MDLPSVEGSVIVTYLNFRVEQPSPEECGRWSYLVSYTGRAEVDRDAT